MFSYDADSVQPAKKDFPKLTPGHATFMIEEATAETPEGEPLLSKAGDPMLKMVLQCEDKYGNKGRVWEYITGKAGWKIKQIGECIGIDIFTPAGILDPIVLLGKTGSLELIEEIGKEGTPYAGRHSIKVGKYTPTSAPLKKYVAPPVVTHNPEPFNDFIPF